MRAKKRHSMLAVILMLGIGIPGSIGIFAVQAKASEIQAGLSNALQAVFTSTPTGTSTAPPDQALTETPPGLPVWAAHADEHARLPGVCLHPGPERHP